MTLFIKSTGNSFIALLVYVDDIVISYIGNHGYIDTSILRIYQRYIGGYFGKKYR